MGKLLGVGVIFAGYTLVWWGWYRLGGPVEMRALIVPGNDPGPRGAVSTSTMTESPSSSSSSPGVIGRLGGALAPGAYLPPAGN